ncbi:MAG: hypothetical protein NW201_01195 [Gemmatimonadales bacterium]|nr:hypothetical protein [Gemmatimonadales bacterium]
MATSVVEGVLAAETGREARVGTAAWAAYACVFASVCVVLGVEWDISWHMTIGRDTFWTPAHLAIYLGGAVSGLACGATVLRTTFLGSPAERATAVGVWGFRGPLGAWVAIWGAVAMITSAPFDNWWHDAYGLDVKILSPPHTLLLLGIISIQFGALLLMASCQNRARGAERTAFGRLFAVAGGLLVATAAIAIYEHASRPNSFHSSLFYQVTGAVFPVFLVAAGRAGALRWPATTAAIVYTIGRLLLIWILPLFEGRPLLAPIYNPVDHFVAPPFPLLLVVPALLIDVLLRRLGDGRDGVLALAIGAAFPLALLAVSWPFGDFLLSEHARNAFFGADQWAYTSRLGDWRYEFWDLDVVGDEWSAPAFAKGMAIAVAFAAVSARIGLWWGNGMRRVVR